MNECFSLWWHVLNPDRLSWTTVHDTVTSVNVVTTMTTVIPMTVLTAAVTWVTIENCSLLTSLKQLFPPLYAANTATLFCVLVLAIYNEQRSLLKNTLGHICTHTAHCSSQVVAVQPCSLCYDIRTPCLKSDLQQVLGQLQQVWLSQLG